MAQIWDPESAGNPGLAPGRETHQNLDPRSEILTPKPRIWRHFSLSSKNTFFYMFRASKAPLGLVSAQGMQKTDFRWRPPCLGPRRGVLGLATPGWRRIFYRKKILGANGWFSGCFGPRDRPRQKKKKKKWVPATCPPRLPPVKTS